VRTSNPTKEDLFSMYRKVMEEEVDNAKDGRADSDFNFEVGTVY
jgi:hypothetical protein